MINKQFDLNSFKAQASKMSDFLNGKGHKIPKSTLYHGLAVMMGDPNWNTLQAKLNPNNIKKENQKAKGSYSDLISFAGQLFSRKETLNILTSIFNECYMTNSNRNKAFEQLINNALGRMMQGNHYIKNMTGNELCQPKNLASHFFLDDGGYFSNISSEKSETILPVIEQHVRGRRLIGNEIVFNVRYQFDFTDTVYDNAEKIFYSALLAETFSESNELYPSVFVKTPMIRINSRGTRVKVSIFSFIDAENYDTLGSYLPFPYYFSSPKTSNEKLIFKNTMFSNKGISIDTGDPLYRCLGPLSISAISLNDDKKENIKDFFDRF